jgi:hypothetical protein
MHVENAESSKKDKHRVSSFESFLRKQGLHEEVHAAALKRAVALKVHDVLISVPLKAGKIDRRIRRCSSNNSRASGSFRCDSAV